MKMLLIGGLVGLAIGVVLTVFYFSLATFFAVNAKALQATQKVAENGNENAEDKSKPGLGREVPSPAKDKSRKSKEVLR